MGNKNARNNKKRHTLEPPTNRRRRSSNLSTKSNNPRRRLTRKKKKSKNLSKDLKVEVVCSENPSEFLTGQSSTILAFRSSDSFLIAQANTGFTMMEQGKHYFSYSSKHRKKLKMTIFRRF